MLKTQKRGNAYRVVGTVRGERLRLAMGTRNGQAALMVTSKIERALAEGATSELWPELSTLLPETSFKKLAAIVGYVPSLQSQLAWSDLSASFKAHAEQLIARDRMSPATWARYQQTLREFEAFLTERGIALLTDITKPTLERFKPWRMTRIKGRKFSRGGTSLALDLAILHRVFAYGIEFEMLTRNPVKMEGRPGDNPEGGAQPFNADQLTRLRQAAGPDMLAFMLLRWTGFRGSDAVSLRWEEIDWRAREINRVTRKRRKRVIVPIQTELHFILEAEFQKRKPRMDEHVLLNPTTGKPMSRPRLYERIKALGLRAEVGDAHPHRFRDTFAVDMLLRGASPFDVAKLLGDTVDTVERYYAPFVRELRERTRRIMENSQGLEAVGTKMAQSMPAEKSIH